MITFRGLGVSALTLACAGRHIEVVRLLMLFVEPGRHKQMLIEPTPLMAACFNRDVAILGLLEDQLTR